MCRYPHSGDLKAISTPSRLHSTGWATTVKTWQRNHLTSRCTKRLKRRTKPAGLQTGQCQKAALCLQYLIKPSSLVSNSLLLQVGYPKCVAAKPCLLICTDGIRGTLTCWDQSVFIYPVWLPILKISPENVILFLYLWGFSCLLFSCCHCFFNTILMKKWVCMEGSEKLQSRFLSLWASVSK